MEKDGKMKIQCQNRMIKPKKFKRQPRSPVNEITTFNKFEGLPIEECNIVEVEKRDNSNYQENVTQEKYDVNSKKQLK